MIMMHGGSDYETATSNGLSHMLEHSRFLGTENWETEQKLGEAIEGIGGSFNAFTAEEIIGYYATISSDHSSLMLRVLADILIRPSYPEDAFKTERDVAVEEIRADQDDAHILAIEDFERLIYSNHPAGRPIGGSMENISKFSYEMLQEMAKTYPASSVTVALVGGIPDEAAIFIEMVDLFGEAKNDESIPSKVPLPEDSLGDQVSVIYKPFDQSWICLGARSVPRNHELNMATTLLATILGGNSISVFFDLFRRQHGMAYAAYTYEEAFFDRGNIATCVGLVPANVERAVPMILDEYQKVGTSGVEDAVLLRAQEYVFGRYSEKFDSTKPYGYHLAGVHLFNGPKTLAEIRSNIFSVTPHQVQEAAKRFLNPSNLALSVVGRHRKPAKFERMLS